MASRPPNPSLVSNQSEISDSGMYTDSEHSDSEYHRASVAVSTLPSDTTTINPTSPTPQTNSNYTNTFQPHNNHYQQSYPQNQQDRSQMMQQMQQQSTSLMQIYQNQNNNNNINNYQSPHMQLQQMQQQSASLRQINTNINNIPPPPPKTPPPTTQDNKKKGFWKKHKKKSSKKKKVKNKSNKSAPKTPPPMPSHINKNNNENIQFQPTKIEENVYISVLPRPPAYTYAMSDDEEEHIYKPQHQNKNRSKRENAIAELIGTEVTYVDQLDKLIKLYANKLEDNDKIISSKDYAIIFPSSLKTILNLNSQLLSDLKERQLECNNNDNNLIISDILIGFTPYFKMYQSYINKSNLQLQILTKCLNNNNNKQFYNFQQKQRKYFNNLILIDLIILPIQRIPRYKLLINEIFKNTNEKHIDYLGLKNALTLICKINMENNEKLKDLDARMKVLNICNEMDKAPNLSSASRRFIYSNELYKIKMNGKIEKYIFYLFNDCIIYGQQQHGFGKKKCIFRMRIPIDAAFGIQQIRDINKYKNVFIIYSSIESFMCSTKDNKELKFKWLKKLINIINIARNNHYFHANLQNSRIGRGSIHIKQAQLQIPKQLKKELNKELNILNMPQTLNPKKGQFRQRYNTKHQMELLTDMEQKMQVIPHGRNRRKNNNINNNKYIYDETFVPDLNELSDDEKEFFMPKSNQKNIKTLNISQSVRILPGLDDNNTKTSGTPPPPKINNNNRKKSKSKYNEKRRRSSYNSKQIISKKSVNDNKLIETNVAKKPPPPPVVINDNEKDILPPTPTLINEPANNILPAPSTSSLLQSNSSDIVENNNYAKVNNKKKNIDTAKNENKKVILPKKKNINETKNENIQKNENKKVISPKKKNINVKKNNENIQKNENKKVISPKINNNVIIGKSKTFTAINENKYVNKTKSKGVDDALSVIKRNRFKVFEENENENENNNNNNNNKSKVIIKSKKVVNKVSKPYTGDVTIWNIYLDENNGNEPTNEWLFHKWIKSNKNIQTISFKQAREMFKGCKGKGKI